MRFNPTEMVAGEHKNGCDDDLKDEFGRRFERENVVCQTDAEQGHAADKHQQRLRVRTRHKPAGEHRQANRDASEQRCGFRVPSIVPRRRHVPKTEGRRAAERCQKQRENECDGSVPEGASYLSCQGSSPLPTVMPPDSDVTSRMYSMRLRAASLRSHCSVSMMRSGWSGGS